MATKKAGGSAKNLRDSNPKYLGVKIQHGAPAKAGAIIVRQRGTRVWPGANVALGKDHSLFALKAGTVNFSEVRRSAYDGTKHRVKKVSVV